MCVYYTGLLVYFLKFKTIFIFETHEKIMSE